MTLAVQPDVQKTIQISGAEFTILKRDTDSGPDKRVQILTMLHDSPRVAKSDTESMGANLDPLGVNKQSISVENQRQLHSVQMVLHGGQVENWSTE